MNVTHIFRAWGRILRGYRPSLSIEITRECPLRCPGCYAYEPEHLGGGPPLRQLADFKGQELVDGVLGLVRRHRPVHLSIVGGEPLVRYRELDILLPKLEAMGVKTQIVTSAVRPIPANWANFKNLHVSVSIDGLPAEHDRRRAPATYDRILKHIAGHQITVHCTITRQLLARPGYFREFAAFWSNRPEVRAIWFSLFTPQQGQQAEERLTADDRARAVAELSRLRLSFPKVYLPNQALEVLAHPPASPSECIFAQTTTCVSADLQTRISPCQFGGSPVCSECGCFASAGLAAIGRHRLAGLVPVSKAFDLSFKIGELFNPPRQPLATPPELRVLN
jgi:sulfatase maturation enzyme AslB (radical SAM superfamily)